MNWKPALLVLALFVGGCFRPEPININSDRAPSAIPAIKLAAQNNDRSAIPTLVHDLDDKDSAMRFAAITALRTMTGNDFGYKYYASEEDRRDSVKLWNQWLTEHPVSTASAGNHGM
jgi:hypothetical protein